ncbi:MAG: phosphoglycerate mutase [Burkholderiales bacterium]
MAPLTHLLIPAAVGSSDDPRALVAALPPLPNLKKLLARLAPERTIEIAEDGPATPFELVQAAALGLPDAPGCTPWAAYETNTFGVPCAFIKLCHWQIGLDQVQALDPAALALTDAESHALLGSAAPWFAEDGIELSYHRPGVWLAKGDVFRDLRTISLDRAIGRTVSRELLQSTVGNTGALGRLQHEMQMLLYDHPTTDARLQRRQLAPNAIWIAGAGVLPGAIPPPAGLQIENCLSIAAAQRNLPVFAAAWSALDAGAIARLAAQKDARLTLAGERCAITFATPAGGWAARFASRWLQSRVTPASILERL